MMKLLAKINQQAVDGIRRRVALDGMQAWDFGAISIQLHSQQCKKVSCEFFASIRISSETI
ncbi:hypothetical protein LJ656_02420 [Paraburkholderia sp. MMS20-SJTR3]|uniref:Uncharacterized protein n=1 Tax=Paraburkholderia sejongensis TaxID=2886946 RepID=A0ABS8JNH5_9BURK|nr:hypothetical protein [Paraburkholderia sp. MMS20-SJTR3]MCC8391428.1 hypothetical protein [Paraburkholderia sp. MMS20-SJTR3]